MPISIVISDEGANSGVGGSKSSYKKTANIESYSNNTITRSVAVNRIVDSLESSAKSMITFGMSNYANFTGDYIGQTKMQSLASATTGAISVGITSMTALKSGGLAGLGLALGTFAISQIVTGVQQSITYNATISKANQKANFNSNRIGVILVNGNR